MIKTNIEVNGNVEIRVKGNADDLAIEFSVMFEKLISSNIPIAMLVGALVQACCQGKLSDDEFEQAADAVKDMLEALADKYFDK